MRKQLRMAKTICKLMHEQRPYVLLLGILSSACKTITAYIPLWFTSLLINCYLQNGFTNQLWLLTGFLAISALLCEGFQYGLEYRLNIAVKQLELQLEINISEKAMRMEYDRLEDKESLDLIEKARAGLSQSGGIRQLMIQLATLMETTITILLSMGLLIHLLTCSSSSAYGIYRFFDSYWAGGLLLLLLLGYAIFGNYLSKGFTLAGMTFFEKNAMLSRESDYYCNEVALNQAMAKDVRIFQMQDAVLEEMEQRQKKSLYHFTIFNHRIAALFSESVFLGNLMNGVFYMLVIIKVYLKSIPAGDFVTYAGTITKLNTAISNFPILYTDLAMQFTYMMFYDEFLHLPETANKAEQPITLTEDSVITFDDVTYCYPKSMKPALQHVSLTLKPHVKTAIVGLNGAGKTTLIKLLCGLYAPTQGAIYVDGKKVSAAQLSSMQTSFGVVFQDFALFDGTLKEAVAGKQSIEDEAVIEALRRSGFGKRLDTLEHGVHTLIGVQSGGIQLSGGEAQKVAIARALLSDRPWIILDEPTAALDPLAEIEIYTHLNDLIQQKSAIYISHRMSSCQFCDDILVFHEGSIVQHGTHAQLLKESGLYQQLWNAQADYFTSAT